MGPELQAIRFLLTYARVRAERNWRERHDNEWGASAIEWAIISAIVVVAAVGLGFVISKIVGDKGTQLQNCENSTSGTC